MRSPLAWQRAVTVQAHRQDANTPTQHVVPRFATGTT
jgi:hypothetical protein